MKCYGCVYKIILLLSVYILWSFVLIVANAIRVGFSQAVYTVSEEEKLVNITVVASLSHTFTFYVTVSTRDGTAICECHATVHVQTYTRLYSVLV